MHQWSENSKCEGREGRRAGEQWEMKMEEAMPILWGFQCHRKGFGLLRSVRQAHSGCFVQGGLWGTRLEVRRPAGRQIKVGGAREPGTC